MIAGITVLRCDLRLWSDFKLFCLLAKSVFFSKLKVELSPPAAPLADSVGGPKMANNNKNYAEFQPWVNLSF